jgi:hypothetical protein
MISHKYRCIFVEVPKTGSTSIRSILGIPPKPHQNIWEMKYDLEHYWTRYYGLGNRLLASFYLLLSPQKRKAVGRRQFESYFKFGFVRNPWDRAVSLYERREGLQMKEKMSFDDFIDWMRYSSSTCVHPVPHRYQLDWFVDPHGRVVVDFIGRFETVEKDWAFIARKLGLSPQLPHLNKNPQRKKHYTEYYTARTRSIVAERFSQDIEYFGYEFGAEPSTSWQEKGVKAGSGSALQPKFA